MNWLKRLVLSEREQYCMCIGDRVLKEVDKEARATFLDDKLLDTVEIYVNDFGIMEMRYIRID